MMLCKDCGYGGCSFGGNNLWIVECDKYKVTCDTTHPKARQCIEDDCDVLWRAAKEKGSRYAE